MKAWTEKEGRPGPFHALLLAIALLAVVLRAWESVESSLWLDELHTLFHAGQPTLAAVSESVQSDNHTPIYFWIVHLVGGWTDGASLRWVSIAFSVAGLAILLALLREVEASRATRLIAAFAYATLPYQVHYGAELRPYPLLALMTMAAFWCAFAHRGPALLRFFGFAACVVLGLLTHRSMAISVFAIGCARLFVRPKGVLHLGWLVLAGSLFVLPFLPWLISFAEHATVARDEHYELVGGYVLREALRNELLQLPMRLLEPVISFLGAPWSTIAGGATVAFGVAALVAGCLWWRPRAGTARVSLSPLWRAVAIYGLAVFVMTTGFSWFTWDRVPLQYYVGMAWVIPLLLAEPAAAASNRSVGRLAVGVLLGSMLAMGIALAGGKSREHLREGVALLERWGAELEAAGERPLYSARLAQPGIVFPDVLPYRAYAPHLEYVGPDDVPQPGDPDFARPLLVFRRVLPLNRVKWTAIRAGRQIVRTHQFDGYIWVYEMRPES